MRNSSFCRLASATVLAIFGASASSAQTFRLSFTASTWAAPITGRAFVFLARTNREEPRLQSGPDRSSEPFFGADISALAPGQTVTIDRTTLGFPIASLAKLPAGDYYVQGLILGYTEFHRNDGHTIWAHMDAGEGQRFNASPGSLVSEVQRIHIDPAKNPVISLSLTKVLPPVAPAEDTPWIKHVHITSKLASAFWGHPMTLGAVVLLPKGYD